MLSSEIFSPISKIYLKNTVLLYKSPSYYQGITFDQVYIYPNFNTKISIPSNIYEAINQNLVDVKYNFTFNNVYVDDYLIIKWNDSIIYKNSGWGNNCDLSDFTNFKRKECSKLNDHQFDLNNSLVNEINNLEIFAENACTSCSARPQMWLYVDSIELNLSWISK